MPENAVPEVVTVTGWLYQPLASGDRSGVAVAVGAETSTFSGTFAVSDCPLHVAVQIRRVDVSTSNTYWICGAQPEIPVAGGATSHTTVTAPGYQLSVQSLVCPAYVHSAEIEFCACATPAQITHTPMTAHNANKPRTLTPPTP